jgi:flagellar biosynthesis regulator FlaF
VRKPAAGLPPDPHAPPAEAAVFAEANRRLRAAASPPDRLRALADTRRLWVMVLDLVSEPATALPLPLRGQIASVAHAMLRECDAEAPDLDFLLDINEQIGGALGLDLSAATAMLVA